MAEMYNWDKSRRNTQNPSFSSTLLDEIYRSIDGSDEKFGEFKMQKQKVSKKMTGESNAGGAGSGRGRSKSSSAVEDEDIASFRRAILVEKWMEMKGIEKGMNDRRQALSLPELDRKMVIDNDPISFSSGSSSSDSSFGWYSEAEATKPKPSCFGPLNRLKQVKTNVSHCSAVKKQQNEFYLFDDDQTDKTDNSGLIRSKTRALKIYANLKKVKQPISPGGRLTSFLNAIFTNGHSKKDRTQTERKTKSINMSNCSSASSFSRSCLSKNTPKSRDLLENGTRRAVRFLDREDSRTYDKKNICDKQDFENFPPTFPFPRMDKSDFNEFMKKYDDKRIGSDDEEYDDVASDSSSDLFELDHLAVFKNEEYCEELPVYETTHLGTNRAIASGLIC